MSTVEDLRAALQSRGVHDHTGATAQLLADQQIHVDQLSRLTEADMADMKIPIGHRIEMRQPSGASGIGS
jgi:hypothetical protein